jgi:hypothetical protein
VAKCLLVAKPPSSGKSPSNGKTAIQWQIAIRWQIVIRRVGLELKQGKPLANAQEDPWTKEAGEQAKSKRRKG